MTMNLHKSARLALIMLDQVELPDCTLDELISLPQLPTSWKSCGRYSSRVSDLISNNNVAHLLQLLPQAQNEEARGRILWFLERKISQVEVYAGLSSS